LNFRVQQFAPDLTPIRQIGKKGDMPGYFGQPKGIAVDPEDHLYVVDANFESVQIFNADGQLLLDFGTEGHNPGEFWLPAGISIDSHNRIWIADAYNRRIQVFDYLPEGKS
jgi:DNA-binding beta-propeller fold protein YncE